MSVMVLNKLSQIKKELDNIDLIVSNPMTVYTVNDNNADEDGNFEVAAEDIGAAESAHTHETSEVTSLDSILETKSDDGHTHDFVMGITVDGQQFDGEVTFETKGSLTASVDGQIVTFTAELPSNQSTDSIVDTSDASDIKIFVGTQAEWDSFTPEAGIKYIAYITL